MTQREQAPIRSTAIKAAVVEMAAKPDDMALSMAAMRLVMDGGGKADTPALREGRLLHMAILEPARFAALPVWDGGRRAGKAWDSFAEQVGGGDYLMPDEVDGINACAEVAVRALAPIPRVVATEVTLHWEDALYGRAVARIDALLESGGWLDVKTCRTINRRAFLNQSFALGYHLQFGWYAHGIASAQKRGAGYVLAVQKTPPYATALYQLPDAILEDGYNAASYIARAYRAAEACGVFSGPYDGQVMPFELPEWAMGDGAVDMEGIG
jgi:hypothetical protein